MSVIAHIPEGNDYAQYSESDYHRRRHCARAQIYGRPLSSMASSRPDGPGSLAGARVSFSRLNFFSLRGPSTGTRRVLEGRALSIASLRAFLFADVLFPTLSGHSAAHPRRSFRSCTGSVGLALGSITDQMEVALAPVQVHDLAAVEVGILFRTELHLLIIPFGDERFSA